MGRCAPRTPQKLDEAVLEVVAGRDDSIDRVRPYHQDTLVALECAKESLSKIYEKRKTQVRPPRLFRNAITGLSLYSSNRPESHGPKNTLPRKNARREESDTFVNPETKEPQHRPQELGECSDEACGSEVVLRDGRGMKHETHNESRTLLHVSSRQIDHCIEDLNTRVHIDIDGLVFWSAVAISSSIPLLPRCERQ